MTIDEKLSHFYDITVEEAHEKAAAILDEHKAALEKMAEEHKTLSEENAQTQIKAETASARREINKALSAEQLTIKRDWTRKQNELKEKIFSEVKGLLESFTKTPEYENYLTAKIKEALNKITEIGKVQYDETAEDGAIGMTVYTERDQDIREKIFYAMAEFDCPILEMHLLETSLEDAFLALTQKEGQ